MRDDSTPRIPQRLDGTCPECGGEASIYPSPDHDGRGHVYCHEDECGWIHRDLSNIKRYTDQ